MLKKTGLVAFIVFAVILTIIILTAIMPTIRSMTDVAASDPSAGNYYGYQDATEAAPLWLYGIPVLVGGILIIIVLRIPEKQSYGRS